MSQTKTGTDHWTRACLHPSRIQWRWRIDEAQESVPCHAHLLGLRENPSACFCCGCCCVFIVYPRFGTWLCLGLSFWSEALAVHRQAPACSHLIGRWDESHSWRQWLVVQKHSRTDLSSFTTHTYTANATRRDETRALPLSRLRAVHRVGREFILNPSPTLQCKKVELKWNQIELLWV